MGSATEAEALGCVARATGLLLGHIHAIPELMSSLGSKCSVCLTDTLCDSEHISVLARTLFCVCLPVSICNVCVPVYGHVYPVSLYLAVASLGQSTGPTS